MAGVSRLIHFSRENEAKYEMENLLREAFFEK